MPHRGRSASNIRPRRDARRARSGGRGSARSPNVGLRGASASPGEGSPAGPGLSRPGPIEPMETSAAAGLSTGQRVQMTVAAPASMRALTIPRELVRPVPCPRRPVWQALRNTSAPRWSCKSRRSSRPIRLPAVRPSEARSGSDQSNDAWPVKWRTPAPRHCSRSRAGVASGGSMIWANPFAAEATVRHSQSARLTVREGSWTTTKRVRAGSRASASSMVKSPIMFGAS